MASLTPDELAILNTLLYDDSIEEVYDPNSTSQTMGDLLRGMIDKVEGDAWASKETYQALCKQALSDPNIANLKVKNLRCTKRNGGKLPDGTVNENSRNLTIYSQDESGTIEDCYVIYKGTDNEYEWKDDVEGMATSDTAGQEAALAYYKEQTAGLDPSTNIVVSGHSKGGNKAMYVATLDSSVDQCVSFDGQGFSQDFHDKYAPEIFENKDKIYNYHHEGDYVSCLMGNIAGHDVSLEPENGGTDFDLGNHAPVNLFDTDEDGNYYLHETNEDASYRKTIRDFTEYVDKYLTQEQQEALAPFLGPLISACGDLSSENEEKRERAKQKIKDLIRNNPQAVGIILASAIAYPDTLLLVFQMLGIDKKLEDLTADDIRRALDLLGIDYDDEKIAALVALLRQYASNETKTLLLAILDSSIVELLLVQLLGLSPVEALAWKQKAKNACAQTIVGVAVRKSATSKVTLTTSKLRDFSDDKRKELLDIVRQVESEPWYDVTTWDVWYRIENVTGRLKPSNYVGRMQEYYRKEIDINDISASDINKMFDDAQRCDAAFAGKVKSMAGSMREAAEKLDKAI